MAKDLGEAALVVVEAQLGLVVDGADVDDDVAGVEDGGVARALEAWRVLDFVHGDSAGRTGIAVGGGLAQQKDGEGLVAVEGAVVGTDDLDGVSWATEMSVVSLLWPFSDA